MVTISIDESNRKKLLSIASDLQKKRGERVDFDAVISHLIEGYEAAHFRPDVWDLFSQPIPDVQFEDLYQEMLKERRRDDRLSSNSK